MEHAILWTTLIGSGVFSVGLISAIASSKQQPERGIGRACAEPVGAQDRRIVMDLEQLRREYLQAVADSQRATNAEEQIKVAYRTALIEQSGWRLGQHVRVGGRLGGVVGFDVWMDDAADGHPAVRPVVYKLKKDGNPAENGRIFVWNSKDVVLEG
jgi:hypothetical protein